MSERLDEFVAESVERIDRYLDKILPPADEPPTRLHEAMRYAVFSGGKRLRPALAFAAAHASGAEAERALPAAAASELVHSYSMVHDDLPSMDDDDERRGRPAVHVRWDEATAILVGDALLSEAFAELGRGGAPGEVVARLGALSGSRGLVGGQVDDLGFLAGAATLESVTSVHRRKTAALFRFAVFGAGALAAAGPAGLEALDRYGTAYGLAYQLVDDLLDEDREECSILAVVDADAARARLEEHLAAAGAALEPFGERAWALRGLAERLPQRLP